MAVGEDLWLCIVPYAELHCKRQCFSFSTLLCVGFSWMLSTQQHLLVSRFDSPSYVFLRDRSVTSEPRQSMKMVIPQQLYNFFIFFFWKRFHHICGELEGPGSHKVSLYVFHTWGQWELSQLVPGCISTTRVQIMMNLLLLSGYGMIKCLYRELTGVDQEIHVLFRLVVVHGLPILEVSLFCSGLNLRHYSPQGKHGNLHCSNVPELHAYLWNTVNRASSILKAVLIKSTGLQLHDLQCNLFNDLLDCQLQL